MTNYVSIKSVLYDLSITIDDRYWNETKAIEWATKALRTISPVSSLVPQVCLIDVEEHKATLPSDLKYLTQIAYLEDAPSIDTLYNLDLPSTSSWEAYSIPSLIWRPLRLTTNPFHASLALDKTIYSCTDCAYEFSISPNMCLTTNLLKGKILVAYLTYPTNSSGDALIPDNESLKEAILHYVLYRY